MRNRHVSLLSNHRVLGKTIVQEPSLDDIYQDQRTELEFHRSREQTIFVWSNTILIGVIVWFVSLNQPLESLELAGYLVSFVGVVALTVFSLLWQGRQRDLMRAHQSVLVQVAIRRGWFKTMDTQNEPLLPEKWQHKGGQHKRTVPLCCLWLKRLCRRFFPVSSPIFPAGVILYLLSTVKSQGCREGCPYAGWRVLSMSETDCCLI